MIIDLQNHDQEHIGFLLPADLPEEIEANVGQWQTDCIFMALPNDVRLFDDPGFLVLASHKDAGEHRLAVSNDGSTLAAIATAPTGQKLYVRSLPSGAAVWGSLEGGTETQRGWAVWTSGE